MTLFTDGSVNTLSKVGYGAYLVLTDLEPSLENLSSQVKVKRFAQTSSTKLELQTLLWALSDIQPAVCELTIYTDSQNIIDLPTRRARLEQNDYCSKKGRRLNNFLLYQEFYRLTDQLDCKFVKVRGHLPVYQKDAIDRFFALVDKAARIALRADDT
ncbi:MAG: ribonuclease H [Desulfuromusa sp.]|nr:ribonuclease H [Desulfuromusa sp.]